MSESHELAHFNYMNLLGKLDEVCRAHKPRLTNLRAGVKRAVDNPLHFARLAGAKAHFAVKYVLARAAGQRVDKFKTLSIEAKRLARLEEILLLNIHNYTSGRTSADRALGDIWPSPIPDGRVIERLIATTLGLASDRRVGERADDTERFQVALQTAVRTVLLPALAWRLLCELHTYHETTREELRQRLISKFDGYVGAQADFIMMKVGQHDYRLGSLILHRAWYDVLTGPACNLSPDAAVGLLGRELAVYLRQTDSTVARANLFPQLTEIFGWGLYGSERAYAIELAAKRRGPSRNAEGKAVFASSRLRLLDAAHSEEVRHFAELTRLRLAEANDEADKAIALSRKDARDVGLYAGMAYWLANACFRRPLAYQFMADRQPKLRDDGEMVDIVGSAPTENTTDYDTASERVARLLEHALGLGEATEDQRLLIRRFLAGFATNPRYWRGSYVLTHAARWVEEYAMDGGRPSLVHQFNARLAWHRAVTEGKKEYDVMIEQALNHYHRCFDAAGVNLHDLDPEAPLHLFPEVTVLVEEHAAKRISNLLETVDFILSRNFSIYMDIKSEKASILAGLKQYAAQPARPVSHSVR